jgi:hypothetical protein
MYFGRIFFFIIRFVQFITIFHSIDKQNKLLFFFFSFIRLFDFIHNYPRCPGSTLTYFRDKKGKDID